MRLFGDLIQAGLVLGTILSNAALNSCAISDKPFALSRERDAGNGCEFSGGNHCNIFGDCFGLPNPGAMSGSLLWPGCF